MDYAASWPQPAAAAAVEPPPTQPDPHHLHYSPYAPPPPPSAYSYHHHYAAAAAVSSSSHPPSSSYYTNPTTQATAYDPYAAYQYYAPTAAAAAPASGGGRLPGYYYGDSEGASTAAAAAAAAASGKEAVRQYGFDPQRYAQAVASRSSNGITPPVPAPSMQHAQWNAHYGYPLPKNVMKKRMKKTKVVQSAFCEVCKIDCNTPDVLKIHKQGRKHKKNLEKLQEAITAKPVKPPTNTVAENKVPVGDTSKVLAERPKKKSALATPEELEVKKRRVLEAGAAKGEVRICTICNVVVNNQKVYEFHMAGQKHQSMVQKQREQQK